MQAMRTARGAAVSLRRTQRVLRVTRRSRGVLLVLTRGLREGDLPGRGEDTRMFLLCAGMRRHGMIGDGLRVVQRRMMSQVEMSHIDIGTGANTDKPIILENGGKRNEARCGGGCPPVLWA